MELIYGTGNVGKLRSMRRSLTGMDIHIIGLKELTVSLRDVPETGNSPIENARQKAYAYFAALKRPVFSVDSGLYIDGIAPQRQPGVHVRNIDGKCLTDEEMIEYYTALVRGAADRPVARYRNGICLIMDEEHVYEQYDDEVSGEAFLLSDVPHPRREKGFPLNSLSIHLASGKYYYDLPQRNRDDRNSQQDMGIRRFFAHALNDYLGRRVYVR